MATGWGGATLIPVLVGEAFPLPRYGDDGESPSSPHGEVPLPFFSLSLLGFPALPQKNNVCQVLEHICNNSKLLMIIQYLKI